MGSFDNVHLCVYRDELTMDALNAANQHHRALMARHPSTFVLGVAQPNLPLPASEVRVRGAELIQENRESVLGAATVLVGGGFWASAVRSVMTASFALARQPYPSKVFATSEEAATWLTTFEAGARLSVPGLATALTELQEA